MSDERLAQLETITDDSVLFALAELMQEFKDGKSGEQNLDNWTRIARGEDVEVIVEEPTTLVDRDKVVQG